MSVSHDTPLTIGVVLFDKATLLDFAAPWDVFTRLPNATTYLVNHTLEPVTTSGMPVIATMTWNDCPTLDVICVPGGPGHLRAMEDETLLSHLQRRAESARYVTAICTGALVLAAAGLLKGYRATTHWMSLDRLEAFGATPDTGRVVIDRNRITGGGVTAGLDFALTLAAELRGEETARSIQLGMEYAPAAPFEDGHPSTAKAETVAAVKAQYAGGYVKRMQEVDAAALARLSS